MCLPKAAGTFSVRAVRPNAFSSMNIPFIKYYKIWLAITAVTVAVSAGLLIAFGLRPGIDFTGGTLTELSFSMTRPSNDELKEVYKKEAGIDDAHLQTTGSQGVIIRSRFLTEEERAKISTALVKQFGTASNTVKEERVEALGAVVSEQLRSKAIWAIALVNLSIIAYLAYAFRQVTRPVASWKYGVMAIAALLHDVLVVLAVFAVLGHFRQVEVDIAFVVALLTVLGFSVNDTIVVYDRIRENLIHHRDLPFKEIVNRGLNETLMRSLNTTFTVLLPLLALYFLGGETLRSFTLALLVGMASGAYSSIFVAAPLLVLAYREKSAA